VIETALSEMDEVIALIYDAPEVTDVPLAVRSRWLRELYPSLRVIEAWGGPSEVGYTPEIMRAHERYIVDILGIRGITHFYSSESYGEHMSIALGAVDRRVDPARERVPISATEIRKDPFALREFIEPLVYRDLVANVVFLGAPSTGKTTLARHLAQLYQTQWMPEYGREYWERHQADRRLEPIQLVEIAEGHLEREDEFLAESNRYLFTDTNAITTATFARYYHGDIEPRLFELAARAAVRYDLTFVCDTDVPYEDTWDRSGDVNRQVFQRQVLADLNARKIPFILLRGSLEERVANVCTVLRRFRKYANPLHLLGAGVA
jgi:NadR type nicotinamide-nucleotide adenylyltransferase